MSKITLSPVGSLIDATTAQTTINNNFDTIQTAMDNTLSRDGTAPDQMTANLDMNSYRILNLPAPGNVNEPARLGDLQAASLGTQAVIIYNAPQTLTAGQQAQAQANIGVNNTGAAYTVKGNPTGSSAGVTDISIPGLIQKASPIAADKLMIADSAASNALKYATVGSIATAGSVASLNGLTGAVGFFFPPQGRLTLNTGVPVMTSSVTSATTLYYTPYQGNMLPIYDGATYMVPTVFAELSTLLTDTTKNPAAIGVNKVNDWFVWNDAGTIRLSHGVDWTNDTTRASGITLTQGIYTNTSTITNGPAANRGTYVGTTRSDGSSRLNFIFGGFASGGTSGNFAVWNTYNRVPVAAVLGDTTASWTYSTAGVWRAANNSATMRCNIIRGLDQDLVMAEYYAMSSPGAATAAASGIGVDTTVSFSGVNAFGSDPYHFSLPARYSGWVGLGYHFISANEYNTTTTASTWYGQPIAYSQSGLHVVTFQ